MLRLTVILQFFAKNIIVDNSSEMYLDINLYDLVTELLYKMESLKEGHDSPIFKGFFAMPVSFRSRHRNARYCHPYIGE